MGPDADAIIIGAGVIGAAIAFELGKRGYRTVNLDKLPAAGYGPTGNSCSIVRAHYSSPDGVAMAYEGFHYWQDWDRYLGVEDEAGLARYMQSGTILLKSATGHHEKVLEALPPTGRRVRGVGPRGAAATYADLRHRSLLASDAAIGLPFLGSTEQGARRRGLHARVRLRERSPACHS